LNQRPSQSHRDVLTDVTPVYGTFLGLGNKLKRRATINQRLVLREGEVTMIHGIFFIS
jgi:hypothetical protein